MRRLLVLLAMLALMLMVVLVLLLVLLVLVLLVMVLVPLVMVLPPLLLTPDGCSDACNTMPDSRQRLDCFTDGIIASRRKALGHTFLLTELNCGNIIEDLSVDRCC